MPDNKPTIPLEGQVTEAEVKQGGTPPKEFRRVKIGSMWLSCWLAPLFPLMVAGKWMAVDYTTTKPITKRGPSTNYNIQEAREIVAPAVAPGPEPHPGAPQRPANGPERGTDRERSIEAQVAAYCTAQVMAAIIEKQGSPPMEQIGILIEEFYQGMQQAKAYTGGVAPPTGKPIAATPTNLKPPIESLAPDNARSSTMPSAIPPPHPRWQILGTLCPSLGKHTPTA